jgi:hypothetical protein
VNGSNGATANARLLGSPTPRARSDAGNKPAKNFFIIFVDVIFTILFERMFTNVFDVIAQTMRILACIRRATPINSLAT